MSGKNSKIFSQGAIQVRGARVHNLKNINVDIPRGKLTVITGLSGSGKSSLAFDTIYAEGQRRYVESLSAYARQFLGLKDKPEVDKIEGLSPAISIDQKSVPQNPRSTVGTITEIYDYLRLLFSRVGKPHCPQCGQAVLSQNASQITDQILSLKTSSDKARKVRSANGRRELVLILAPVIRGKKGEYRSLFSEIQQAGFLRVRLDGEVLKIEEAQSKSLDKNKKHMVEVVVDRLVFGEELERDRVLHSVETALKMADGILVLATAGRADKFFSEKWVCLKCGLNLPNIEPRNFSFNSPYGACSVCTGLGIRTEADPELIIPNKKLTLGEGAIRPWASASHRLGRQSWYYYQLEELASKYGFSLNKPVGELSKKVVDIILWGNREDGGNFEGVIPELERKWKETESEWVRAEIEKYMVEKLCSECKGRRLNPWSLAVKLAGFSISEVVVLAMSDLKEFFEKLSLNSFKVKLSKSELDIALSIVREILRRTNFLLDVGLDYLTLERSSVTLSGGESQRIRLATQIGSGLTGVTYILDEPSIGLHERDQGRLIATLKKLRDLGNTVIVVEHDRQTIESADWVCDIGPGAGLEGGRIVFEGRPSELMRARTLTGDYLSGRKRININTSEFSIFNFQFSKKSQTSNPKFQKLSILGASEHNLKNIDVEIPLGRMVAVTGVSGSGKSTLVNDILARALLKKFYRARETPGAHKEIQGVENIDKVVLVDQSPIGRTPRSNPATYTGVFNYIRDLFAKTHLSRMRGYERGRFSFNVKGGRCEACEGQGVKKIEMFFLPDVYVECEECRGSRYSKEVLEIEYAPLGGEFELKNIAQVLDMSVSEALNFFETIPALKSKLKTLEDVGLGYIKLGQSAPSLSGGEAQRVKLATELSHRATGRTLYILDEPTTGLHFDDVAKLLRVLRELVNQGNTVLIIEHNMDVIRNTDWIIDLGPEGGGSGGELVAEGSPAQITKNKKSITGKYLVKVISNEGRG